MENEFLTVTKTKKKTESFSMRVPKNMLREIDQVAEATGKSRNEILTMSLEFALKHMEIHMNPNSSDE